MLTPVIQRRPIDPDVHAAALAAGYSSLQAQILGARLPTRAATNIRQYVSPALQQLDGPDTLPDIEIATQRIADAVMNPTQVLALISDHDVDGLSGHSVLRIALIEHFGVEPARVQGVLSHKKNEGYGVSAALLARMLQQIPPPALCITIDQGSQDNERFKKMVDLGYEAPIVTDHHHCDEPPSAALACVNPTRKGSTFPDPYISGCHVAFLVACSVRRELMRRGYLPSDAPNLFGLGDIVGCSVVADAVSMSRSINNRAMINHGLRLMNLRPRPAWVALREVMRKEGPFNATELAMGVAPRLNALSRMGDALPGVNLLCTKDLDTARRIAAHADGENQSRKAVERSMTEFAIAAGEPQAQAGRNVICVYNPEGHQGTHGISASRLLEAYGRPAVCLAPKHGHPGILTGSLRSIPGVDIYAALVAARAIDPTCMESAGGHSGAAGVTVREEKVPQFCDAMDAAVRQQRDLSAAVPVIWSDGDLAGPITQDTVTQIEDLAPHGREFEAPLFEGNFAVAKLRQVGDGTHLKLTLIDVEGDEREAVWFRAMRVGETSPVQVGEYVSLLYSLAGGVYRGKTRIEMHVKQQIANS